MRVGVGGVLYLDGQLLLGLRRGSDDLYPAKWDIIGGHMEPGETVEQVVVREFQEELGVRPLRFECLGVWPEPDAERYGEARYHIYVVHEWHGEPRNCSEEHSEVRWFAIDQLESLDLASREYVAIFSHLGAESVPSRGL
jgi:mutator protein MutT